MGLGEKLRRLDDRFIAEGAGGARANRWMVGFGLAVVAFAVAVPVVASQLDEPRQPLGFDCIQPAQPVVEDVLDLTVETSGGVGGQQSTEATAYWGSGGRKVVLVTCRSASAGDLADGTPSERDPGYVEGEPAFVLVESEQQDYASAVRFTHGDALVVIETASPVEEVGARELVASWVNEVEMLSR